MKRHKSETQKILDCIVKATGEGIGYLIFGLWVKAKHPEIWKEFLLFIHNKKAEA
jgi:hypothetical protein